MEGAESVDSGIRQRSSAFHSLVPTESRQVYDAAPATSRWLLLPSINHFYKHNPEQVKLINRQVVDFYHHTDPRLIS